MVSSFRQKEILDIARKDGKVTVDGLAEKYNVTVQTIRRDLSRLTETGKLERVHGGAVVPSGVVNIEYEQRRPVSYTHLRAHETDSYLVCRLLLEKNSTPGPR